MQDHNDELCQPQDVHWASGTEQEYDDLCNLLVKTGTFTRLNEKKPPEKFRVLIIAG